VKLAIIKIEYRRSLMKQ